MADLVLHVGSNGRYDDGDILCAFSERHISHVHASHACHVRQASRTKGFLDRSTRTEDLIAAESRWRFERTGPGGVYAKRISLVTLDEDIVGPEPNSAGEVLHVSEYLKRRLAVANHRIFGSEGREVWYGGTRTPDLSVLATIWARIEAETALREVDHRRWPLTQQETKSFLPVAINPINDGEAGELVSPLLGDPKQEGEPPAVVKQRAHGVHYRALFPEILADIDDRTKVVDLRTAPLDKVSVIARKLRVSGGSP